MFSRYLWTFWLLSSYLPLFPRVPWTLLNIGQEISISTHINWWRKPIWLGLDYTPISEYNRITLCIISVTLSKNLIGFTLKLCPLQFLVHHHAGSVGHQLVPQVRPVIDWWLPRAQSNTYPSTSCRQDRLQAQDFGDRILSLFHNWKCCLFTESDWWRLVILHY